MLEIQNFRGRLTLDDIIGFLVDYKNEVEEMEKELEKANDKISIMRGGECK